jgi:hypothetical protein
MCAANRKNKEFLRIIWYSVFDLQHQKVEYMILSHFDSMQAEVKNSNDAFKTKSGIHVKTKSETKSETYM